MRTWSKGAWVTCPGNRSEYRNLVPEVALLLVTGSYCLCDQAPNCPPKPVHLKVLRNQHALFYRFHASLHRNLRVWDFKLSFARALMLGGEGVLQSPLKLPFFRKKGSRKSPVKLEDGVWRFPREDIFKARGWNIILANGRGKNFIFGAQVFSLDKG